MWMVDIRGRLGLCFAFCGVSILEMIRRFRFRLGWRFVHFRIFSRH